MSTPSVSSAFQPMTLADKWYFGAYLNLARHNFYLLLADISKRLYPGQKDLNEDAKAFQFACVQKLQASTNTPADEQEKIINELNRQFRWLSAMVVAYATPQSEKELTAEARQEVRFNLSSQHYYEVLHMVNATLNGLRNEYTHDAPQTWEQPKALRHLLHTCFDAARRTAKERFKYTDAELAHLVRKGKNGDNPRFHYGLFTSQQLSIYGICFFTCLLLEKKYAAIFTANIKGLKDRRKAETNERAKQASFETFAAFCVRLPNNRVQPEAPAIAFGLDMLNELMRCPAALFEVLGKTDQQKFVRLPDTDESEEEPLQTIMKRSEDRFPYFTQRFIDEMKWFESIRFPIDLGNYHFHLYNKEVDNHQRTASYDAKIIGWGRMSKYMNEVADKPASYQQLTVTPGTISPTLPYIVDTTPHYHLEGEGIALRFTTEQERDQWPELGAYQDGATGKPFEKYPAHLKISPYEVPLFIMTGLLLEKTQANGLQIFEGQLKQYYQQRINLYHAIVDGSFSPLDVPRLLPKPKGAELPSNNYLKRWEKANELVKQFSAVLSLGDLQDEIRDWIMGIAAPGDTEKASRKLSELIAETELRQKRLQGLQKRNPKPGEPGPAAHLKSGRIADFIARDMLWFQPKEEGLKAFGKPTALLFRTLQSKIAYFSVHASTLVTTYRDCRLLDSSNPHPFLEQVIRRQATHLLEFYEHYLQERLKYLKDCQRSQNPASYPWLSKAQTTDRNKAASNLASNILKDSIPIAIPRGFFAERIRQCLAKLGNSQMNKLLGNELEREHNSSYLLLQYHHLIADDDFQPFYKWPRVYNVLSAFKERQRLSKLRQLSEIPTSVEERQSLKQQLKQWISTLPPAARLSPNSPGFATQESNKRGLKLMEDNEKLIRHEMLKDVVLHAMSSRLFHFMALDLGGTYKLKTFDIESPQSVLEATISYSKRIQPVSKQKNGEVKPITITQDKIKIKNIGDFNRFTKDLRLENLINLLNLDTVTRAELEDELTSYDYKRIEAFYIVQQFEKRIVSAYPSANPLKFEELVSAAVEGNAITAEGGERARWIRNAFAHNQYPAAEKLGAELVGQIHRIYQNKAEPKAHNIADLLIESLKADLGMTDQLATDDLYNGRILRKKKQLTW